MVITALKIAIVCCHYAEQNSCPKEFPWEPYFSHLFGPWKGLSGFGPVVSVRSSPSLLRFRMLSQAPRNYRGRGGHGAHPGRKGDPRKCRTREENEALPRE